jgi:hypothetical protein
MDCNCPYCKNVKRPVYNNGVYEVKENPYDLNYGKDTWGVIGPSPQNPHVGAAWLCNSKAEAEDFAQKMNINPVLGKEDC